MSNSLRNYEIKQKLGSGSYGVIYKVVNKADKSTCVLKQISLTRMSEKARKNATNEAHIMGKLKHPFIVCYFDSFVEDNNLNILMEFCDGGDLSYFLKQQNKKYVKEEKIWRFFIQICMGLEHIHKNKILHRDIKTLNIFLSKNEMVKIGDLGVAKMLNSNDFAHTMVGTPFYLSPQLCEQKPYNQKSDIWALGCLLYELCTFKHPFEAANQASLILKIIRERYEPIPQFYSKDLREMIDMCLERDYKRRPTANMILTRPSVRKMIEQFELNKRVQQFFSKPVQSVPKPEPTKPEVRPEPKQQAKIVQPKPVLPPKPEVKVISAEKPRKFLDEGVPIIKPQAPTPRKQPESKQKKKEPAENVFSKKRESQPLLRYEDKEDKPKVLFGNAAESKQDFVSALEAKMKNQINKIVEVDKQNMIKRPPVSFQIPAKIDSSRQIKVQQHPNKSEQGSQKITIHNKQLLLNDLPPPAPSEMVYKVKMEKKVEPKIYEAKPSEKPMAIIKSGGFKSEQRPETGVDRKKSQPSSQNKQPQASQPKQPEKAIASSMKNIRKTSQDRPSYLPPSNKAAPAEGRQLYHYPPKAKRPNQEQVRSRPPKQLPHPSKAQSTWRYTQVSKQEEDLVANLPDIVKKEENSSEQEPAPEGRREPSSGINFKQIDERKVLEMYEQMQEEDLHEADEPEQTQEQIHDQAPTFQQQPVVEQKIQEPQETPQSLEQEQQIDQDSQDMYYQINKYLPDPQPEHQEWHSSQRQQTKQSEWEYDEEPELPMLEETETPLFEEPNPYLVEQAEEASSKTEEELLEDKKHHLQRKLKENIKREDEINRLMQMKIEECKAVVPKHFDEILTFFRAKINMDKDYTAEDEREVEQFLARRNLTDERKFQNIYKIMHFEMELETTRKIIQEICKKLNELERRQ